MTNAAKEWFLVSLQKENMTGKIIAHGLHSINLLEILELYRQDLGISEFPEGTVTVIPGTENGERELDSPIPIYTKTQLKIEPIMEKMLYNLRALAGFQPHRSNSIASAIPCSLPNR